MTKDLWYFAQEGRQQGPVSLVELQGMLASARLTGNDLVWRSGMESWSPARGVPGLLPRQPQPVLPGASPARGKRFAWKLVAALILVATLGGLATLWQKFRAPSIDALVDIVPQQAKGLVIFRGLPQLAVAFDLWKGDEQAAAFSALTDLGDSLGLDLSDKTSLLKTGIDVTAPIGISLHRLDEQEVMLFYLPVAHAGRLEETIGSVSERQGWSLQPAADKNDGIVQVMGTGWTYTLHQGHLIAVLADPSQGVPAYLQQLRRRELGSVEQAEWFSSMGSLVGGSWHVLGLIDPQQASSIENSAPKLPVMAAIDNPLGSRHTKLSGLGAALNINPAEVRFRYQEAGREGVEHGFHRLVGVREDRFASRVAGRPLGAARLAIDPARLLAWRKETDPETTAQVLSGLETAGGADLEREVLPFLGSPLSLAVLRNEAEGTMPASLALWLPLKPGHAIGARLESLAQSMGQQGRAPAREEQGGVIWYHLEGEISAGWGLVEDHLVVTLGGSSGGQAGGTRSVLASKTQDSFLSSISRGEVRETLRARHDIAVYVDLPEVLSSFREDLAKNVPDLEVTFLEQLGEMTIWVDSDPRMLVSEWVLYPARSGGFTDLATMLGGELSHETAGSEGGSRSGRGIGLVDSVRQKRTVADIRNLGTAYMSWLTDQIGAAAAGARKFSFAEEGWRRLSPEEVRKDLRPSEQFFYMEEIPLEDHWGHPIEVWRNDNLLASNVLLIRSPGRDGRFEGKVYEVGPFPTTDFDQDIVWHDGYFLSWPSDAGQ